MATTIGYGPRFLHSTGQLHKGGSDQGVFIQITAADKKDVAIPGEPYGFSVLKEAQALGDLAALNRRGRRAVRVHLKRGGSDLVRAWRFVGVGFLSGVSGSVSILIARDEPSFLKKAVMVLIELTASAAEARQRATWSLSGGNTPKKLFQLLSEPHYKERIPWPQLHLFWGDERCVPPEHPDSNYKMVRDALLSKISFPDANTHRMPAEMAPATDAARAYDQSLKVFFKYERPFPAFDVMMLGMGDDGHTASLFPGTTALEENEKWVASSYVEKFSANRLTLTYPVINNARRILIMCAGDGKASVLKEVLRPGVPVRFPVQRVQPQNGELIWLLDHAAASKLSPDVLNKSSTYLNTLLSLSVYNKLPNFYIKCTFDPVKNPYSPGAGAPPPELAGREKSHEKQFGLH